MDVLEDNLRGAYLYGSLAWGCYHPSTSDLDFIVIVGQACADAQYPDILHVHEEASVPVDAVFATEEQVNADMFPTSVEFFVKPMRGHRIFRKPECSRDFLMQRQDAYEAGVALVGTDPREFIRPVPWPLLVESLDYLFPHIVGNFKNPVLMLCRMAYAHAHQSLCCKRTAGEWALETLDERWRPVIQAALSQYAEGSNGVVVAPVLLHEFEEHCSKYISDQEARR